MFFLSTSILAALSFVGLLLGGLGLEGSPRELMLVVAMASASVSAACLIGALQSPPPSGTAISLAKRALALGTTLALLPFAFIAGTLIVIFTLPVALVLLPLLAWRAAGSEGDRGEHRPLLPRHA